MTVATATIKIWRRAGLMRARAYNDRDQYLYEYEGEDSPVRYKWKMGRERRPKRGFLPHAADEVQYETQAFWLPLWSAHLDADADVDVGLSEGRIELFGPTTSALLHDGAR